VWQLLLETLLVYIKKKGDMNKALEFYEKSLKLREDIGSKQGIANSLNSIGQIYQFLGNDSKALDYYNRGLILAEEINNKVETSISLNRIGSVLYSQKKYNNALAYYSKGMAVAKELAYPENIKISAMLLAQIYKQLGDYKNAYVNYELYIKMRDSISNQETKNASLKSQLKYEYEKKAATDSILVAEEKKLTIIKFNEQENQRYFLYAVLTLTILFGAFMFNRFRITKKQKIIIELKRRGNEKNKEIL
jgi:tetratricopeptide (TPR) repeat protein